jgi:hypothetical protein
MHFELRGVVGPEAARPPIIMHYCLVEASKKIVRKVGVDFCWL